MWSPGFRSLFLVGFSADDVEIVAMNRCGYAGEAAKMTSEVAAPHIYTSTGLDRPEMPKAAQYQIVGKLDWDLLNAYMCVSHTTDWVR